MTTILIITENLKLLSKLNYQLSFCGFIVESVPTIEAALELMDEIHFRIILLDSIEDRIELSNYCQEVRHKGSRAGLILMSDSYQDHYLRTGVDDYILKPFGLNDLRLLINKQLERMALENSPLTLGELKIDVASSMVYIHEKILSLGKKELEVLIILTKKAGRIIRPNSLMTEGRIHGLRKKLKKAAGETLQIKFIKGLGYKLTAQGT